MPMISPESQHDESTAVTLSDGESVVVSKDLPSPPPYASGSSQSVAPQPRCNYLLEHRNKKGSWNIDLSLSIPESLLPPITEFDGRWNEDIQKLRKDKKPSSSETRPNLMIMSEYGGIKGDVQILGESKDPAVIVVESRNGPVNLDVNAAQGKVVRIFAYSDHGEVKVWIPSWFEGALVVSTSFGDIKMSDGIKAKLTIFSSKSDQTRGYIGDWQASGFGSTPSSEEADASKPVDVFTAWFGPAIRMGTRHGSVSLGFLEERPQPKPSSGFVSAKPVSGFFGSLFGWGGNNEEDLPPPSHSRRVSEPVVNRSSFDHKELPPMPSESSPTAAHFNDLQLTGSNNV